MRFVTNKIPGRGKKMESAEGSQIDLGELCSRGDNSAEAIGQPDESHPEGASAGVFSSEASLRILASVVQ
jgi:hypothetical protein